MVPLDGAVSEGAIVFLTREPLHTPPVNVAPVSSKMYCESYDVMAARRVSPGVYVPPQETTVPSGFSNCTPLLDEIAAPLIDMPKDVPTVSGRPQATREA